MEPTEQDLFDEALAIEDPGERAAYLARGCRGDQSLRGRVESLIAAYLNSDYLESPAEGVKEVRDAWRECSLAGATVGGYTILELIGEGGMGDVYLARRSDAAHPPVALKVIKPGMDSRQVIARFELERTALAKMDHPHIAQFIEAGVTDEGRAYFAMELVRGLPITSYCDRQQLGITQRLKLLSDVCLAVQHAHSKGLVHRDLKPGNVLVAEVDGEPIVKVIDFGVAKALDPELSARTIFTRPSQLIGTPLYMSPEQVRWCPNVDIRSDVYSLGVLIYELMCGSPPFDQQTLNEHGFEEFRRIIQEEDPLPPSRRIASLPAAAQTTLAATRSVSPKQLRLQVRGDLDCIALMALAKQPGERYGDPGELAEDVYRFLTHRIIHARAPRLPARVRKWARRHPRILSSICSIAIIAVVMAGAWQVRHVLAKARIAASAASQKEKRFEYFADLQTADAAAIVGDTQRTIALLDKHKPGPGDPDDVGFEWHYLRSVNPRPLQEWKGHQAGVLMADVSPDEKWVASCDRSGEVLIWNPITGEQVHSLRYGNEEVTTVKFSPDGKWLATAGVDRVIRIWKTDSWDEVRQLQKHNKTVCAVAWSPDGERLASGGRDGDVHIWEVSTGRHLQTLQNNVDVVCCVSWSHDGLHLASGNGRAGGVNLWDTTTCQLKATYRGKEWGANSIAFSNDGTCMAFGGYGGVLTVVDLHEPKHEIFRTMVDQIWSLNFLPGDRIAVGLGNGFVESVRWHRDRQLLEPQRVSSIDGQAAHRSILQVSGGRRVILASEHDFALKLMSGAALWGYHVEPLQGTPLGTVAGDLLYVDRKSRILLRDGFFGATKSKLGKAAWGLCPSVQSIPTGLVAIAETHKPRTYNKICVYDSADWRLRASFRLRSAPVQMSFSKDGRFLVGGSDDGQVWKYDLVTDKCNELTEHWCEWHAAVAFSPTADLLAIGKCGERSLKLLSVPSFEEIQAVETQSGIKSIAFHPNGDRVAVGEDGSIAIRDAVSLRTLHVLRGHPGEVFAVAYSPNGRTLASAGLDGIRLWDAATGREFYMIGSMQSGGELQWLQFLDSTMLLAGNGMNLHQYGEPCESGRE